MLILKDLYAVSTQALYHDLDNRHSDVTNDKSWLFI